MKKTKKCSKCNKNITVNNYNIHFSVCKGPIIKINWENYKISNGQYKCNQCNKILKSKRALISHSWLSHTEQGKQHAEVIKPLHSIGRVAWNKGLTKDTDDRIKKSADTLSTKIKNGEIKPSWLGKHHSEETKKKIAIHGGYRKGSGRGKKGYYKGYWCDSSWELAFVIYNLEHEILFARNTTKFEYFFNGKTFHYIPDFIISDEYIEIKGYENEKWNSKVSQFPHKLKILKKNDMEPYLEYVINKYGKNFIKLYD